MELLTLADVLHTVALAIALAACAGLRAWLPLLLAGIAARMGWLQLGPAFQFLASDRALWIFGVATAIEVVADKFPALDHALDVLSTPLRPVVGALLAAATFGHFTEPLPALVLGTAVGAPAAFVPHVTKSMLRTASTTLTGGLANPIVSLLEDGLAALMFVLAVLVPVVVVLLLLAVTILVARRLFRARAATRPA